MQLNKGRCRLIATHQDTNYYFSSCYFQHILPSDFLLSVVLHIMCLPYLHNLPFNVYIFNARHFSAYAHQKAACS